MSDEASPAVGRGALELADEAIDFAGELGAGVHRLDGGTTVVDLGVAAPGGRDAGLLLATVRRGGLLAAEVRAGDLGPHAWVRVEATTGHPTLASELATTAAVDGWTVSGPGLAGHREPFAVVTATGTDALDDRGASAIADAVGVDPGDLYVLTAAPGCAAWTVDAAVGALERAVGALEGAVADARVTGALVDGPLAPAVADGDAAADLARAFCRHGGRAHLAVAGSIDRPALVERLAAATADDGPAVVTVVDDGGTVATAGATDPDRLVDRLDA